MSDEPEVYGCPRCGTPLAPGIDRCPMCGMARGVGSPSPFSGRWWLVYLAVFLGLVVGVTIAAYFAR